LLVVLSTMVAILDAYLDSRKVNESYQKVTELLVCDRIKSTLPEGCLRHILPIESSKETGWLPVHELAEAVDVYFANRWQHGDKPRAGALGIPASTKPVGAVGTTNRPVVMPFFRPIDSPTSNNKRINVKAGSRNVDFVRRCFI